MTPELFSMTNFGPETSVTKWIGAKGQSIAMF